MCESDVVGLFERRDPMAVVEFERLYGRLVWLVICKSGRWLSKEDVEEIYNDVLFVVWDKFWQFDKSLSLKTWSCTIAIRRAYDRVRRATRRARLFAKVPKLYDAGTVCDRQTEIESSEIVASIVGSFAGTGENSCRILMLDFAGHSYIEMASILGIPLNTVKSRLSSARCKLRKILEDYQWCSLNYISSQQGGTV